MGTEEKVKIKNFCDLLAWQEAHQLSLCVYRTTREFPRDEVYGLVSQMRRASVSVSSNIAEGFGRRTNPDKRHFYDMAGGSLAELQSQLHLARDLVYLPKEKTVELLERTERVYKLLNGLIGFIS